MLEKDFKNTTLRFDNYIGNLFYSILTLTFLFYNNKLLLIYFSSITLNEKIKLLSQNNIVYLHPIIYSLIIMFIYLVLNLFFRFLTLQYNKIKEWVGLFPQEKIEKLKSEKKHNILEQDVKVVEHSSTKDIRLKDEGYEN